MPLMILAAYYGTLAIAFVIVVGWRVSQYEQHEQWRRQQRFITHERAIMFATHHWGDAILTDQASPRSTAKYPLRLS